MYEGMQSTFRAQVTHRANTICAYSSGSWKMHSGEGIHAGTPGKDSDLCWDVEVPHPFPERGARIIS